MKSRTKARSVALQTLYEVDVSDHKPGSVLSRRFEDLKMDGNLKEFISRIVSGVIASKQVLDEFISDFAPDWPLDQVTVIDRNLLRMAFWEIAVYQKTPVKVVVNETVELAKLYGADGSSRFINGVLGGLLENLEEIKFNVGIVQDNKKDE